MFGGNSTNPYDDVVIKTTDENLTSENWELILNLCDKVSDEGQEGARNVIASILKRLAHRNPNVQLYALALTESLSKNCGAVINREIASKAFTQGLEKLIMDRNSHDKVRKRALFLILTWTTEFENDASLGVMEDCYNNLKGKGYKFEAPQEPLPPSVDDEIRRKEEEELQRVLELSMQDKGGRSQWSQYSLAASSSASSSASQPSTAATRPSPSPLATKAPSRTSSMARKPAYQGGYAPARTPSPATPAARQSPPQQQDQHQRQAQHRQSLPLHQHSPPSVASYQQQQHQLPPTPTVTSASPTSPTISSSAIAAATPSTPPVGGGAGGGSATYANVAIVTRVRALHAFEPTEPGELAFEKGDIIRVVDRGYKDWWRGQLKGRTGIFPVNYVEPMPEPTAAELGKEAEQEASVFAQAVNVEKLLNMLRSFDPAQDNLADNEEIQELYRSCMALRPKIVKLIDKYSQKRADLVSMNETFVRARAIFDRMMEESLAKHSSYYEHSYHPTPYPPDPRARVGSPVAAGPQPYGWNAALYDQPGYNPYPPQGAAYPAPHDAAGQYPQGPSYPSQPGQHEAASPYIAATPAPAIAPLPAGTLGGASAYNEPTTYVRTPQGQVHVYSSPGTYPSPAQVGAGGSVPYGATAHPAQGATQPQQVQSQVQAQQAQAQVQPQTQAQTYQQEYQTQEYSSQGQPGAPQGYHVDYHGHPQQQPAQVPGAQAPQGYHADYQGLPQQQQPQQQPAQVPEGQAAQGYHADYQSLSQQQQQGQVPGGQATQGYHADYPQQQHQPVQVPGAQPVQGYHADYQSLTQQQQPARIQSPAIQTQILQPTQISPQAASQTQHQATPQSQPQSHVRQMSIESNTAGQAEPQAQQPQGPEAQDQPPAQLTPESGTSDHQVQSGPPYVFDPYTTYSDPNVQAWAQYYAQGGKDPAGAVYFFSVPGVTDGAAQPQQAQAQLQQQQQPQQAQVQPQQQQQPQQYQSQSQYQHQSRTSSTASLGSSGAHANNSPSNSPKQSLESYPTEQQQAAIGANYAYAAGVAATQAQQLAQLHKNRQPLNKGSYSSLTGAAAVYTSPKGGNAALPAGTAAAGHQIQGGATPSWVIPKKNGGLSTTSQPESPILQTTAPVGAYGAPDPAGGQPYYALSNQFATMSVADQQQHH